mmetsp:Transcript_25448/g.72684  ORF Transcript_25448/g.72684 Transcript_25448/m.72684 type:complete len:228 (+) Transcript_25448:1496-2179(+)
MLDSSMMRMAVGRMSLLISILSASVSGKVRLGSYIRHRQPLLSPGPCPTEQQSRRSAFREWSVGDWGRATFMAVVTGSPLSMSFLKYPSANSPLTQFAPSSLSQTSNLFAPSGCWSKSPSTPCAAGQPLGWQMAPRDTESWRPCVHFACAWPVPCMAEQLWVEGTHGACARKVSSWPTSRRGAGSWEAFGLIVTSMIGAGALPRSILPQLCPRPQPYWHGGGPSLAM